jgi:probable F420-dependent oxidoreductase
VTAANLQFGILASSLQVPDAPPTEAYRKLARTAEQLGADSIWAADRIASRRAGLAILEGITAISFFAGLTDQIALGTSVLVLPVRHPVVLAKQLASLDHLSAGRLVLGVGLGENPADYQAAGVPYAERAARCDELIVALRTLWAPGPARFQGRFYSFEDTWLDPPPHRPGGPQIWVGGGSPAARRRAGRFGDGWHPYLLDPEAYRSGLDEVRAHADQAGRDPAGITGSLMLPAVIDEDGERARELAVKVLGRAAAGADVNRLGAFGTPAEVLAATREYVDAGATNIVFNCLNAPIEKLDSYRLLLAEVALPLRASPRPTAGSTKGG